LTLRKKNNKQKTTELASLVDHRDQDDSKLWAICSKLHPIYGSFVALKFCIFDSCIDIWFVFVWHEWMSFGIRFMDKYNCYYDQNIIHHLEQFKNQRLAINLQLSIEYKYI
jgi:hypothetical protein